MIEMIPVEVIDSGQLSLGLGYQVLAATRAIEKGFSLDATVKLLNNKIADVTIVAALDTVEFLKRSGRLSNLKAGLASLLDIKPIIKVHKGIISIESARTTKKAIRRVIHVIQTLGPFEYLDTVHTHAHEGALALREQVRHLFPHEIPEYNTEVTPVIGTHIGPGAVGFVCVKA